VIRGDRLDGIATHAMVEATASSNKIAFLVIFFPLNLL
jgi:hypothetical protein